MTIKYLTKEQKQAIINSYCGGEFSIEELCGLYSRSRQTILRVLKEFDCAPEPKAKANKAPVIIPTKTPWWRKWFTAVIQSVQMGSIRA